MSADGWAVPPKHLTDPVSGQPWNVLVVLPGEAPVVNVHRANNGPETVVEFYDARQDPDLFGQYGQYVSGYYLSSLVDVLGGRSLALVFGIDTWTVSAPMVRLAVRYALDVLHAVALAPHPVI